MVHDGIRDVPGCRLLPYGPRGVLAEYGTLDEVLGVASSVRAASLRGVVDVVPAARTVLVAHDGSVDLDRLHRLLAGDESATPGGDVAGGFDAVEVAADLDTAIEIAVRYDGADLAEVAELTGCSVDEVVALHSGAAYRVAFCGFQPGFAYLIGLPAALHVPRLASPRPRVDAGSVAIAGEWAGVYPAASPGGWRLLGHTDVAVWDDALARPALLEPGVRVRFVAT